jgi:hypothetical protein
MNMFEHELQELQRNLDRIDAGAPPPIPDWKNTVIGNYDGGILREAARISGGDWWRREPRDGREIIALLDRGSDLATVVRALGDGKQEEQKQFGPRGSVTVNEVVEHQHGKQKAGVADELNPEEDETISAWFARLAKAIDSNGPKKLFWDALKSYASRFRGDVSAKKNLDAKLVATFLKNIQ